VLGKVIGTGGAGEVYLAEHRSLRRITALKVIKDTRDRKTRERFKHEVRVTASLTHPNTVTVYDFGTQGETLFFAMEYLEGATVGEVVERSGPMPAERVIHILEQVCGSLEEAHAKGFIHRDIKPDNVFLAHRGSSYDFVKVLDFGLVKEVDAEISPGKSTLLMGTPGYIAPEAAAMGYRPRPERGYLRHRGLGLPDDQRQTRLRGHFEGQYFCPTKGWSAALAIRKAKRERSRRPREAHHAVPQSAAGFPPGKRDVHSLEASHLQSLRPLDCPSCRRVVAKPPGSLELIV
jgi:serine/threonine protein kinase